MYVGALGRAVLLYGIKIYNSPVILLKTSVYISLLYDPSVDDDILVQHGY